MLSFYNFVFQRLTWKKIRVPYGLIIYFSRNEKLQKYRIILSKHTNYLHKWLVPFLTFLLLPCFFFFNEIPKYVQAKNRLAHLDWHFVEHAYQAGWVWWIQADSVLQAHFSQNSVFIGCNIFFSSFDYLFELIFGSYTASRVLNIWRLKYKSI